MRSKLILLTVATLVVIACQPAAPAIEYTKYESEAKVPRISAEEAKKEFDAGNVVFVDSRGEGAWKMERLPGALNIPAGSTDFSSLPKGKKIIVYCT